MASALSTHDVMKVQPFISFPGGQHPTCDNSNGDEIEVAHVPTSQVRGTALMVPSSSYAIEEEERLSALVVSMDVCHSIHPVARRVSPIDQTHL